MDEDKRLSYFFLGWGIGVAAGILFAPKSGEETRDFLRQKADESGDFLKRRSEDLRGVRHRVCRKRANGADQPARQYFRSGRRGQGCVPRSGRR